MPINNFNFPRVTVNQEFSSAQTLSDAVLPVCVIGPQYNVRTYDRYKEALKASGDGPNYTYPGKVGVVDTDTVQVLYKNAAAILFTAAGKSDAHNAGTFSIVSRNGKEVLDSVKCQLPTGSNGEGTAPVCFAAGLGKPRSQRVATDIAPGDKLKLTYTPTGEHPQEISVITTILAVSTGSEGGYSVLQLDHDIPAGTTEIKGVITRVMDVRVNASYEGFTATKDNCTVPTTIKISLLTSGGLAQVPVQTTGASSGVACSCYVQYSQRMSMYNNNTGVVSGGYGYREACQEIFGDCSHKNPLGLAVLCACSTATDQFVYFMSVPEDTPDAYREAIDFLGKDDTVYSLVICSQNKDVVKCCLNQVNFQAGLAIPFYRILWYGLTNPQAVPILKASSSQYSEFSTTQENTGTITLPTVLLSASGIFDKDSLHAGDAIVFPNGVDTFGAPVYLSCQITDIKNGAADNTKTLTFTCPVSITLTGDAQISITRKHGYTRTQLRNYIIDGKCVSDRRAAMVYADNAKLNGQRIPNYAVAAAAAGMRSHQEPHRPLSNLPYTNSFTVEETNGFTDSDLRILGSNGIWLVGNNAQGVPINRKQLTTAASNDINKDEQSLTTNIDSICRALKHIGRDFVGNSNISPMLLTILQADCVNLLQSYLVSYGSAFVGPQLLSYNMANVWQDPVVKSRVYARLSGEPPKPFNDFDITFALV